MRTRAMQGERTSCWATRSSVARLTVAAAAALVAAGAWGDDPPPAQAPRQGIERPAEGLRRLEAPAGAPENAVRLAPLLEGTDGQLVATEEGWRRRREAISKAWRTYLGEIPRERGPVNLEVLRTEELEHVTRSRVRYRIEDGITAEAYLLRPRGQPAAGARPARGAVVFHSTVASEAGEAAGVDATRADLHIGLQLAQRGWVALCPRCFIFDGAGYAGEVEKALRAHEGWKGMTRMLFDAVRAADVLESLPGVDAKRLACIGHSLGAKEALYAAAFDDRFRAAVFSEGGIGIRMSNWDAVWYLGPRAHEPGFARDHHELLALIAPRSFLLLAGGSADGPESGAYIAAAQPVWRLLGAPEKLVGLLHGNGHAYPPNARAAAEAFLESALP